MARSERERTMTPGFRLIDNARAMRLHLELGRSDGVEDGTIRLAESEDDVMQDHGFHLSSQLRLIRREIEREEGLPDTPEHRHARRHDREFRLHHLRAAEESALAAIAELRSDRVRLKRFRSEVAAIERRKREARK